MAHAFMPKDLYQIKSPGMASFSPDGSHITYVVAQKNEDKNKTLTNIYLYDIKRAASQQLTYDGMSHSPVFSPRGDHIAFISSRSKKSQIWLISLAGGEAWCLPTTQVVSGPLQWSSNGSKLFYQADIYSKPKDWIPYFGAPQDDAQRLQHLAQQDHDKKDQDKLSQVKVITRFKYRADREGYFGPKRQHIFSVKVNSDRSNNTDNILCQQWTHGDFDYPAPALSPNGQWLAVVCSHEPELDVKQKKNIFLYNLQTAKAYCVYEGSGPLYALSWSDDGLYLAFTGHDHAAGASSTTDLWLLSLPQLLNEEEGVSSSLPLNVDDALNITRPLDRPIGVYGASDLRQRGGKTMVWNGGELYFLLTDRGITGVYKYKPQGQVQLVWRHPGVSISSLDFGAGQLLISASSPDKPEEIYLLQLSAIVNTSLIIRKDNPQSRDLLQPITQLNTAFMRDIKPITWHSMAYVADDGYALDGWIVYPPDYAPQRMHPLVLLVHGGPHGAYGPSFMSLVQLFSTHGYVVAYGNPRGSETYGQAHACVIDKNWGDRDYADVMATVDAALARGGIDPEHIFMHGWSYGGYMACWLATQTSRFRAICSGASVTNLLSGMGTSDINLDDEWEYGGLPWQNPLHLIRHSPIGHVQNVTTPLLLMHGEKDLRVPISQTEEFYIALKRLEKDVVMIRYPGEYHGLKQPRHQVDRYRRLIDWFEAYGSI